MNKIADWPLLIIASTFGLWIWWVVGGIVGGMMALNSLDGDLSGLILISFIVVGIGNYLALPLLVFVLVIFRRLSSVERIFGRTNIRNCTRGNYFLVLFHLRADQSLEWFHLRWVAPASRG